MKKIGFIGAGNMAKAIITGIINKNVVKSDNIIIFDIDNSKTDDLSENFSIKSVSSNKEIINSADIIVIAVKPQSFDELSVEIKEANFPINYFSNKVVVSIMAGINTDKIKSVFENAQIIRTMPNTPALIGKGVTGIYYYNTADETKDFIKKIFDAIGFSVIVEEEDKINGITAISGSGPGYFFLIMECFQELSNFFNISNEQILKMITATIEGSAELVNQTKKNPDELRKMVTSYKGTTAAALDVLEKNNFKEILKDAVKAAYYRAQELSK